MSGYFKQKAIKKTPKTELSEKEYNEILSSAKSKPSKTLTLTVTDTDNDFTGVAYRFGKNYHIKNTVTGDVVTVLDKRIDKKEIYLDYYEVETPSAYRREPVCPFFNECGNCNLLHIKYDRQLKLKTDFVTKKVKEFKTFAHPSVGGNEYFYRNKVHLAFTEKGGKIGLGFFNEETHNVVEIKSCFLHEKWLEILIKAVKTWATELRLTVFKPWTNKGLLRFISARYIDGKIMVTVVATERLRSLKKLYEKLAVSFKEVVLYQNVNNKKTSEIFSDEFYSESEVKKLEGQMNGVNFRLSPNSFFQVNTPIAEKAYAEIIEEIKSSKEPNVLDCFSGIGITSVAFAKTGKSVTSIEIVKKAVEDARELAKLNGVENIKFICGDCNEVLRKLKTGNDSVFFVDPPRKGLGQMVVNSILAFAPKKIVYLSCNIETLVLDLKMLTKNGYTVKKVTPYDFFANTRHVETLVVLTKKE